MAGARKTAGILTIALAASLASGTRGAAQELQQGEEKSFLAEAQVLVGPPAPTETSEGQEVTEKELTGTEEKPVSLSHDVENDVSVFSPQLRKIVGGYLEMNRDNPAVYQKLKEVYMRPDVVAMLTRYMDRGLWFPTSLAMTLMDSTMNNPEGNDTLVDMLNSNEFSAAVDMFGVGEAQWTVFDLAQVVQTTHDKTHDGTYFGRRFLRLLTPYKGNLKSLTAIERRILVVAACRPSSLDALLDVFASDAFYSVMTRAETANLTGVASHGLQDEISSVFEGIALQLPKAKDSPYTLHQALEETLQAFVMQKDRPYVQRAIYTMLSCPDPDHFSRFQAGLQVSHSAAFEKVAEQYQNNERAMERIAWNLNEAIESNPETVYALLDAYQTPVVVEVAQRVKEDQDLDALFGSVRKILEHRPKTLGHFLELLEKYAALSQKAAVGIAYSVENPYGEISGEGIHHILGAYSSPIFEDVITRFHDQDEVVDTMMTCMAYMARQRSDALEDFLGVLDLYKTQPLMTRVLSEITTDDSLLSRKTEAPLEGMLEVYRSTEFRQVAEQHGKDFDVMETIVRDVYVGIYRYYGTAAALQFLRGMAGSDFATPVDVDAYENTFKQEVMKEPKELPLEDPAQ